MKQKSKITIPVYLFLINGLTLCFGFIFFVFISLSSLEKASVIQTKQNLKTFAHALENIIISKTNLLLYKPNDYDELRKAGYRTLDNFLKYTASHDPSFRISIIDENGTVIADSDSNPSDLGNQKNKPEVIKALEGKEGCSIHRSAVYEYNSIFFAIPFYYKNKDLVLRLSMPMNKIVFFSSSIKTDSFFSSLIVLTVVLGISFLIAIKILKPLTELKKMAKHYQSGDFEYEPQIKSPSEFVELADTFTEMSHTIKKNFQHISNQRDELQAVFSGITEALIVFNSDMQVFQMNEIAMSFFLVNSDIKKEEKKSLSSIVENTDILTFVKHVINCEKNRKTEIETRLITSEQAPRSVLVRCVKMNGSVEGTNYYLLVVTDISRLKRLEKVRKDFVSNVSHELKTPITAIKGFIETLQNGALEEIETAKYFLSIMDQQSSRLINILEDLLMLSKLEQKEVAIETEQIDLRTIVLEAFNTFKYAASQKNISLICSFLPEDKQFDVFVNPGLFIQALSNLVDNAIKYCPENSEVKIKAIYETTKSDGSIRKFPVVHIFIEDNGFGIPEESLSRIFERFYRLDKGRSRDTGGTGLGLSIVRHIIELHGGNIKAILRADNQSGACFEILLPVRKQKRKVISI